MNYEECVPLSQHDILDASECGQVRQRVMELRKIWTPRTEGSFFTLGAASYLDATGDRSAYLERARRGNPVLWESFGWLQERVRLFAQELLDEPAFFDPECALPGFHIFVMRGEDRSLDQPSRRAHFDLQWMQAVPTRAPAAAVSLTLPIEVPSGGASMEIWHVRYKEAIQLGLSGPEYAMSYPSQTIGYVPGRAVVHDGLILHAIGRAFTAAPTGYRITLQGHGVRLPEGWLLYW